MGKSRTPKRAVLSTDDQAFALEYLGNGENATKAYLALHPKVKATTAAVQGCRLLRKPKIAEFLAKERRARFRRLQIDGDEVLALVSMDARARVADVLDASGNILPVEQWPESMHNSIEQYEKRADGSVRVKLASKTLARRTLLEQTGKLKSPLEAGLSRLERALRHDLGVEDDDA